MMLQYFESIVSGLEKKIAEDPSGRRPRRIFALELARLGKRLYDGEHRVAWCGVATPFDVLGAMDITSCFVEFVGASLASSGMVDSFLEQAENGGFVPDMCTYHRSVLGAAMNDMMPVPEILVATTCPCTAGISTIENLARIFDRELYIINVPQQDTPDNVDYLAEQLQEMTGWVSERTGIGLDAERLRDTMTMTNRIRGVMCEVYDLASHVPSPATSKDLRDFGIAMPLLGGTEASLNVAVAYRDEFERRIAAGESGIEREKSRLLWVQNRIQFKHPLTRMLEEEFNAVVVADELNTIAWKPLDTDDPWPGIARRMISIPMNGPIVNRVDQLTELARQYRVDGAINPCHWGCRQGAGSRGMIQAGLRDVDVPVMNLEVDCVDPRPFAEGQLKTRLEAFMEMIETRPSPWE